MGGGNYMLGNLFRNNDFKWENFDEIKDRKDVILLDVRTADEFKQGRVDGFINIPLQSIQGSLNKLDSSKTVYVMCLSGSRSKVACDFLNANGYKCINIAGGISRYHGQIKK